MTNESFNEIIDLTVKRDILDCIKRKGEEYSLGNADRLVDFKQGASLTGQNATQVLFGYLLKHIVNLTNMVQSGDAFTQATWDEKTKDIINYCILIRGTVVDDKLVKE